MASKRHYIEGDAIGGGGVAVQPTQPTTGDLWFNTETRTGTLYAKVNDIFRRSSDGACYPSELYCTRRDLFAGKRLVSRSRTKKSTHHNYIATT